MKLSQVDSPLARDWLHAVLEWNGGGSGEASHAYCFLCRLDFRGVRLLHGAQNISHACLCSHDVLSIIQQVTCNPAR